MFSEPDASYHGLVYTEHFGEAAYIARCRSVYQRTTGAVLSPLSAFLLLQGIETVALRVERHVENARAVAEFLRDDPRVAWVNYAGFADSPYHALAQKYLGGRACSLLTFGVAGGLEAGKTFYDALKLVKRLVNIGDAKSLACHPASTTHRQMSAEEQRKAGVTPEMIRLSVGIEHIDDIIADLDQALAASRSRPSTLDRGRIDCGARPMPLFLDTAAIGLRRRAAMPRIASPSGLSTTCPTRRVEATERQFADLLRAATPNAVVRLSCFRSRTCRAQRTMRHATRPRRYRDISRALGHAARRPDRDRHRAARRRPDGRALLGDLEQARRLGAGHTASTIWSCLAAHAAVLHVDGIERRLLTEKCFGVFDCRAGRRRIR